MDKWKALKKMYNDAGATLGSYDAGDVAKSGVTVSISGAGTQAEVASRSRSPDSPTARPSGGNRPTRTTPGGTANLALMGVKLMSLPEEPFVRFAGLLSESERLQALEAATVVICPSPYESLSLLALEAMSVGTPVLVNARSPVLVEHCVRSNAGLWYADRDEFVECLADKLLTYALGRGLEHYDQATVREIRREAAKNGYRFSALALAIANSVPFQMRSAPPK